jgi:hypothetical protein
MYTKQEILKSARVSRVNAFADLPLQIITWQGISTFYIWRREGNHNSYVLHDTWHCKCESAVQAFEEIERFMSWEDKMMEMEKGAE